MSDTRRPESWFDRLAVRYNRRQALKAAAAGAIALPLIGAKSASAFDSHACQQGCLWTTHRAYDAEGGRCLVRANGKFDAEFVLFPFTFGLSFTGGVRSARYFSQCIDRAVLTMKQHQAQCGEDGCPGFNPYGQSGPCEGVQGYCCPCGTIESGYIPCVYACDDPDHNCCPAS